VRLFKQIIRLSISMYRMYTAYSLTDSIDLAFFEEIIHGVLTREYLVTT
jgi:hypothetical protein